MTSQNLKIISIMEKDIADQVSKSFGKNLVSLVVIGSYGNYDIVDGYSDYDLMILVKDVNKASVIDFTSLSKKYLIDIRCVVRSIRDFEGRIKNNGTATRYVGNLDLIKMKKTSRVLSGMNILSLIPGVKELVTRDLSGELQASYLYATNPDPAWNIFVREPHKWANYIINMCNAILLSSGVVVRKSEIAQGLKIHHVNFTGLKYLKEALALRSTKRALTMSKVDTEKFKKNLHLFLEAYRKYVFY